MFIMRKCQGAHFPAPRRPLTGQCACLETGALYNNILFTYDVPD